MRRNILIVGDIVDYSDMLAQYLSREGFAVKTVACTEDAFVQLDSWKFNLIILDINLPGMNGFELLTKVTRQYAIPVIITSARVTEEDQIIGLGIGADDYITKPFSHRVFAARVHSLFRRLDRLPLRNIEAGRLYNFGPYTLDMEARTLKKDCKPIELSAKEYAILAFLAENDGKPLTPETIYKKIWNGLFGDLTTIPVHIQRLRKKIEDNPARPIWLVTSRGMGYKLDKNAVYMSIDTM